MEWIFKLENQKRINKILDQLSIIGSWFFHAANHLLQSEGGQPGIGSLAGGVSAVWCDRLAVAR